MKKRDVLKIVIVALSIIILVFVFRFKSGGNKTALVWTYISSDVGQVQLYNLNYEDDIKIFRGTKVKTDNEIIYNNEKSYQKIIYNDNYYLIESDYIGDEIIKEKEVYVRTPLVLYETSDDSKIRSYIKKGEKLDIVGFDKINDDGTVNMYKVLYDGMEGFVYAKYVVLDYDLAIKNYDNGFYNVHQGRGDILGGGNAFSLDYYPYDKPRFLNNVMPDEVRSLYINRDAIKNIDAYISLAKETNINAFVVDIKDNTAPTYKSEVMKELSITNYNNANMSIEEYRDAIKKLKDNNFYVIGRITTFKDDYYATDNKGDTIFDNRTNSPYLHNGSYWPSAYSRNVWYFNVSLAKEAVNLMGFNEIQFDYVRFPDRTSSVESYLDYKNIYGETKAEAIQRFVMYACDELHKLGVYVSIDVFAECAHAYVTSYGQYFPAISNVADVVSAMPYPDHFNKYQYGFKDVVWTRPYDLLKHWGLNYVLKRQQETTTPAIIRTWIQAYDTIYEPYITYDSNMVSDEIRGLYDASLDGGYITWNGGSSLVKYNSLRDAFSKNYKE